jgi:hypothetical protein
VTRRSEQLVGTGRTFVVVDALGCGVGEMVLIVQGSSARFTPETEKLPIDAVIIGIVDSVHVENKTIFRTRRRVTRENLSNASNRRTDPFRRAGSPRRHAQRRPSAGPSGNGRGHTWGVFTTSPPRSPLPPPLSAVRVAAGGSPQTVACIRKICSEQAEQLGREELEETKIGRLPHKIEKLKVIADRIPGVEFLKSEVFSGENGIALQEYAPFGVIGVITPVTHSLPTLACNAINMLAAGNALVCNPHPSGARIATKGTRLFNQAIHQAIGIDNLITIIEKPTLESAQAIFDHRDVKMLCVTGGPAVGRAALRSPKRAIVAGPGNPPVVVDETADLDRAARAIVEGGAYDNNLLCIGEKQVFAVVGIFDELMEAMSRNGGFRLNAAQVEALTKVAFVPDPNDKSHLLISKELLGQDAAVLAEKLGSRCRPARSCSMARRPGAHRSSRKSK